MSALAHAGTDNTFGSWVDQMTDWVEGSLGKGIAISFVIVGIIMGVVRQSLMAFAIGVGAALGLIYAPGIINNMFSAVL
ncbi:pili assembly chaperone [Vibrio sp. V27_P1S3P104]|uniref:TraA family conjugative transfer protein n=1 Tax=unclassified Vibrio TaxID=2614977 RepID=UPI0013727547|nr:MULTISPECIES: TraA family conjugative transfer protein [unclassified Vibrio]NAX35470.1 pili assembly chaperone [Vibrio sp. V29_P1S30P107]NAX38052.1 pili assembly chaperone [Vibrio sp. V27_P1S3P104]